MSFTLVHDTNWSIIANTSAVSAGSTLADGWVDNAGSVFSVSSGQLLGLTQDSNAWKDGVYLLRPSGETAINSKITGYIPGASLVSSGGLAGVNTPTFVLRFLANDTHYFAWVLSNQINVYASVSGNATQLISQSWSGYNSAHSYQFDFSVSGTSPTALSFTLTDVTASAVMSSWSSTDSTAGLQSSGGRQGVGVWAPSGGGGSTAFIFTRVQTYTDSNSPLTAGSVTVGSSTNAAINISASASYGGTTPYSYQWHRSTTSGFTPGAGTTLTGRTSLALSDTTASAGVEYFYRLVTTDSATTPATVSSIQVAATLWAAPLVIGFLGDSITYGMGASTPPGTLVAKNLSVIRTAKTVTAVNEGVSGSRTAQWVPGQSYLTTADADFASAGVTIVSLMLGHNDAVNSVSAATYGANLAAICAHEVALGRKVIVHYPIGFKTDGSDTNYTEAVLALWETYRAQIDAVCNGTTILKGDTIGSVYFAMASGLMTGVHPNDTGNPIMAQMWASAIDRALNPSTGGTGGGINGSDILAMA